MVEIKIRPEAVKEEDLGVLMTLPKHEVAQTLNAAGSHEEIKWRVFSCVHVLFEGVDGDVLWVGKRGIGARRASVAQGRRVGRQGGR